MYEWQQMGPQVQLPAADRETLVRHARTATGCPDLEIDEWQTTCLSVQRRRSVFRFAGMGHNGTAPQPWSLILKVLARDADVDDPLYWEHESILYAAGIPQQFSGVLRAPHCFDVLQPRPDVRWIWLEDLTDYFGGAWPLARYSLAAHHLGSFNAVYLSKPLPPIPWLSDDSLRSRSAKALANAERLVDPTVWANPHLRRAFPRPVLDEFARLIADREKFLDGRQHLPQTLCHLDAWHGNMCAVRRADGVDTTVLFDWALAGAGVLGEEISPLIWIGLLEHEIDVRHAASLEAKVIESYLNGLKEAGWQVDWRAVRCGYLINAVLNFGLVSLAVDYALNEDRHARLQQYYGRPLDVLLQQVAAVVYLLFERANELRILLDALR